jgi:hypothetical protein
LTYFREKGRILSGKIEDLDILFIYVIIAENFQVAMLARYLAFSY